MKVGIMGAGQLGRMLALAGYPLGLQCEFLDPNQDSPGGQVGPLISGGFDDRECLARLARDAAVVTFEFENVPMAAMDLLGKCTPVWPPAEALGASQDRLDEKTLFRRLKIPTPEFAAVDGLEDLRRAARRIGLPGILKTRRLGYDGRGQYPLRRLDDIEPAWSLLGKAPLIYEKFIAFSREVSLIGVRSTRGETRFYPLCANTHEAGILRYTTAPYRNAPLQKQAETYLKRLMRHFDYAGVLTVEFFVRRGQLIANEMAPRVHNSGHWTIEGARTSQFENHLRAVLGLPLGDTAAVGHSAMVNFIGTLPAAGNILRLSGVHFHSYGKEPRPNRKLGHCTVTLPSREARDRILRTLLKLRA
ncbi:5-(carboxyamino)imidazole ribonucleotide synthase [Steroidobacter denitrificans]|uniref:N5-carboxyaminoimidazole ribonucleotide synthase n=1 Tax=Steroidobacter denitrificans TaxID=465721 RepID=A0A127FAS9_STEDE|nr:5-(carboxyamino)imidazole ribonucleotide synthase [Steroidobacter denitrificans]AMN46649.1 5-(carboxyamino)imidazole ribonucleotide synthase [Steroidobacter denitrificans]